VAATGLGVDLDLDAAFVERLLSGFQGGHHPHAVPALSAGAGAERAIVVCVDDKAQIQARRTQPARRLRPAQPGRHSHNCRGSRSGVRRAIPAAAHLLPGGWRAWQRFRRRGVEAVQQ